MTRHIARGLVACAFAFAATAPAFAADLTGTSVDVALEFPSPGAILASRTVTVGAGAEISCPGGSAGPDVCVGFQVGASFDLGANSITLDIDSGSSSWNAVAFNGYRFDNLAAGGAWSGYTLSTNFIGLDDSRITFSPDTIDINMQGITASAGQYFTLTLQTAAVPEPENLALMLAGLGALAGLARRKRA